MVKFVGSRDPEFKNVELVLKRMIAGPGFTKVKDNWSLWDASPDVVASGQFLQISDAFNAEP
jgi:hypothetical protein